MKKILLTAALAVIGAIGAQAQLLVYDGFNYTSSGTLAGNSNADIAWSALNSGTAPTIASGSLSVSGLQAPTGNSVSFPGGNSQEVLGTYASVSSGTVYYSLAFQVSSISSAAYIFGLATGNTNYGATVWARSATGGFNLGLSNRSNSTETYDTTVLSLNTTYFLVASYEFVTGTGNDISSLWIAPSSASFGSGTAPTPTLTATGGTDMTAFTQFLQRGAAAGNAAGIFDELRIGTTWASVTPVPEPTTTAMLGGLGAMVWVMRRRRAIPA